MNYQKFYRSCLRFGTALTILAVAALFSFKPATQRAQTSQLEILLESKFDGANNDGWTIANGTQTNKWFVGAAAGSSAGTTNRAAYASNDPTGATFQYLNATPTFNYVYMYRDIDIPAELPLVTLSFDFKGRGEGVTDTILLYSIPTNQVPIPGNLFSGGALTTPIVSINGQSEWTRVSLPLPPSQAGTSRRIMFAWGNNITGVPETLTSVAFDNVLITARPATALAGSYSVNNALVSNATNFNSLGDAIVALNSVGLSAPTTFNVSSGQVFSEALPEISRTGTAANTITFQKSGALANPIVRATGGGGLPGGFSDGLIRVTAADYITFDGIDAQAAPVEVIAGATVAVNPIDMGYLVRSTTNGQNGSQNVIVKNTSITLDRTNPNSFGIVQASSVLYGGGTAAAAAGANSFNKYYNLKIENANAGIYLLGTPAFPDEATEIGTETGTPLNFIGAATPDDIGGFATTQPTFGIRAAAQSNPKIFNNEIRNLISNSFSPAASIDGIWIDNSGTGTVSTGTAQIYNNRIHDLRYPNPTSGRVTGIRSNLTNNVLSVAQIYNNFVYNLDSASTTPNQRRIVGIFAQESGGAAASQEIYYNSVRLQPSGIMTTNTTFEIGTTGSTFKVRNNIFANFTGTQTVFAKHYTWVTPTADSIGAAGSISDNNVLHIANPGNGFTGLSAAIDRANLPAWRSVTGTNDANSRSQNPQFVSATDLHIRTDAPTPVESAGAPIMLFNTDIDGQTRNATTPDIGADEGNFQVLTVINNDIAAASIARPAPGLLIAQNTVVSPQAIFQNVGAADQTNINVRLTITGPGGYNYSNDKTIASLTSENLATVTFDAAPAFVTLGTYTITATVLTADQNSANNTITGTFTVSAPLSGNKTVGAGGDFPTLATAIDSLNAIGVSGATTLLLTDANYNIGTTSLVINPVSGASLTNRVVIKPAAGVNSTISGTVGFTGLITLNGADFVTIDGSNNGTNSRNLTVINNSANTHAVIYGATNNFTDGAQNNVFKNANIVGGGTFSTGYVGIGFGGALIGNAGNSHNNNRIENCNIQRTGRGIFFQGASAAIKNQGNIITRNTIGNATVSVTLNGIYVALEDNIQITENTVSVRTTLGNDIVGISLGITDASTNPTGLEVTNAVVARNKIESVFSAQGLATVGIAVAPATSGTNLIANNFVAGVISPAAGTDNISAGILLGGGTGSTTQVYHNSIAMTGVRGAFNNQLGSFGIAIAGSDPIVDLRNNIFLNTQTQTGAGTTGRSYAVGFAYSTFANLTADKNDYFVSGEQATFAITGGLTNATGTERANLAALQTATGRDANSLAVDPLFVTAMNLHLQPRSPLRNLGVTLAGIIADVEGNLRDTGTPDIGADEVKLNANLDFDGDGKTDYSVFRDGIWYVRRSASGFAAMPWGIASDKLVPADYDGDGRADFAVFRDGNWFVFRSSDNALRTVAFGLAADKPLPGDFDGDAAADIAVFRPSSGTWFILQSSNNQSIGVQFGQSGDVPVTVDFDADGKNDIAVFRPSNGTWYWLRSSDNQFRFAAFGQSGDVPQSGDFNGDGASDLVVFRPSNGTWYIARPTGVPAQNFDAVQFGLPTDIPVAADYDGDSRTDIAVVRQTNGTSIWYSLDSGSGAVRMTTFGAATDKVVPAAYLP